MGNKTERDSEVALETMSFVNQPWAVVLFLILITISGA